MDTVIPGIIAAAGTASAALAWYRWLVQSLLAVLAVVGVIGSVLLGFARLAIRARDKRVGISFLGPFADLWDPAHLRTDVVIASQSLRGDRAPEAGAPPGDIDDLLSGERRPH